MAGITDVLGALGGPAGAVQAGLGIIQSIGGLIGQGKAKKEMARLQGQRKAFVTPEEVYMQLQATQANAQSGLGSQTLQYLTGQNNNAFSSGIGALALAGGDANSFGNLFEQSVQNSMQIAGQDQAMRMANFSKYLGALNTVAANKEAEQISKDNLLKDRIQAVAGNAGQATKSLGSGVNAVLGSLAAGQQMRLYNQNLDFLNDINTVYSVTGTPLANATTTAQANIPATTNAGTVLAERGITTRTQ